MAAALRIAAYSPRWHFQPGEAVSVHVSTACESYRARLVRLLGPVGSVEEWRTRTRPVETAPLGPWKGREQPIRFGSYMVAPSQRAEESPFCLRFAVRIDAFADESVLAQLDLKNGCLRLQASSDGRAHLVELAPSGVRRAAASDHSLPLQQWTEINLHVDVGGGLAGLRARPLNAHSNLPPIEASLILSESSGRLEQFILAGISDESGIRGCFDGKIDTPALILGEGAGIGETGGRIEAQWDLGRLPFSGECVAECRGAYPPAQLFNGPARGVTSSAWRGRIADYSEAPDLYAAAHFHRDDLDDAVWPEAFNFHIPADVESGAYALVLHEGDAPDWSDPSSFYPLPLFVTPRQPAGAKVAVVLPTFSYRAYANSAAYEDVDPRVFQLRGETASKPVYDYARSLGLKSLYDTHAGGGGVHLVSLLRPQATIRPDFVSTLLGVPHQFSADLAILQWLEEIGVAHDILTDEVLHSGGPTVMAPYDVVITGSHPEYASGAALDAFNGYVGDGGSLMYLGGNGFYWRVGIDQTRPWRLEARRSEGVRTWSAAPGERRQQTDGAWGGLWRALGRPPNLLVGLGFSAHGFSGDGAYRLNLDLPLSRLPPRLRSACEGLQADFGVAGLELDRYDVALGSPADAIVLARASRLPSGYVPAVEDIIALDALLPDPSAALADAAKGDIILMRNAGGGYCFSVGSIRWTNGLTDSTDSRHVRDITGAVLFDLLDDASIRRES